MALIERIMHWGNKKQDTEPPTFEPSDRHIAVHQFFAAVFEVAEGPRTRQQIKDFYSMTAADEADFDALADQVSGATGARALVLEGYHAVFLLAAARVPNYTTPAEVRMRVGI
jgi:hypothetical protein